MSEGDCYCHCHIVCLGTERELRNRGMPRLVRVVTHRMGSVEYRGNPPNGTVTTTSLRPSHFGYVAVCIVYSQENTTWVRM